MASDKWLSLGEVAKMLGVHPSTVRSWSDEGELPVHRTQGGHRRYFRSELELWMQAHTAYSSGVDAHLVVQNALRNTRFQISEGRLSAEAWYNKLDEEARDQYRKSGRMLMQGLVGFLTEDGRSAEAEAEAIGYEYASRGRRHDLSAADAVNAFLFFRNVLIESLLSVFEAASVRSPFAWSDIYRKINLFTDLILIKILETYEAYQRGKPR
ncbi:MAG TPA: helix-turn-helix domain-containing protein [Anaerolineales bacterium]|nr:helix-turn-helix domain-containing protein [Anaerolineales bacterium]